MVHPDIPVASPENMDRYEAILKAAEKYMRVRKADVHIPLSFHYALKVLESHPEADADVVAAGIILHDIGWYTIDEEEIYAKGFSGPNMLQSDIRFLHESEGVRLSRELLSGLGYNDDFIEQVCAIIDGHDTRTFAKSLNDEIVRDADKLWRFCLTGVAVACDWFKLTPSEYMDRLEAKIIDQLHLDVSIKIAREELAKSRKLLMANII